MLDENRFKEIYDSLRGISEYDADILTGQSYGKMAAELGITRTRQLSDAVSMQAAAAEFRDRVSGMRDPAAEDPGVDLVAAFAESLLRERLAPYPEPRRKALMISMLEVSGQPLGERERMQLAQEEEKAVEGRLAEEILRLAWAAWQDTELRLPVVTDAESNSARNPERSSVNTAANGNPASLQVSGTFCAGAAAGAAYLSNDLLRARPALIGAVTGAVSAMDKIQREDGTEEILEQTSRILLMISTGIVLSFLLALSSGAAYTAAADLAEGQGAQIWSDICTSLRESAQLFADCLKIAWGTAAAGLAAEAFSRLCARSDEAAVPAGIHVEMDMDMEEFTAEQSEDLDVDANE